LEKNADKHIRIESVLDWDAFRPIVSARGMCDNKSERGSGPNIDEVVMFKLRMLQQWHGLSDQEHEGFEYVGIFDWCVLDPLPPVVTDDWIDLHMG